MTGTTLDVSNRPHRYKHEKLTKEGVEEVVESYRRMNWWP